MKITLEYFLSRRKKDLKHFILKNKIESYEDLKKVCKQKIIIPCDEETFNAVFKPKTQKVVKKKRKYARKKKTGNNKNN